MTRKNGSREQDIDFVRGQICRDKKTAQEVLERAREQTTETPVLLGEDITGAPKVARSFNRFLGEQKWAIEAVRRDLYFSKVETTVRHGNGEPERRTYLVTKHRVGGGLISEEWTVVSWTAPITAKLLDREVGGRVEFQADHHAPIVRFQIEASAKYGRILPELLDTTYCLSGGQVYVEHERLFVPEVDLPAETEILPEIAPEAPYEAAQEFGLSEIIELADVDQREVMHLPFKEAVLVEGPPGSGKTSIGLMRIPCLIDRQWGELGLNPSKDLPFHEISSMLVLVLNEEMVDYLAKLIRSVGVHGVRVLTFEKFCQQICRDARTLSGVPVRESPRLSRLKLHALTPLVYWAGFRQAVGSFWARRHISLLRALTAVGHEFGKTLVDRVDRWVSTVRGTVMPDKAIPVSINLPQVLRSWRDDCQRLRAQIKRHDEEERAGEQVARLQSFSIRLARRLLSRHAIVRSAVQCEAFGKLCAAALEPTHGQTVTDEWLDQARQERIAESDGVLAAWLATFVSHVPSESERQGIGMVRPRLTHVLIDEAQDVSPCHLRVIQRLLDENGTITMVGDLRQRITPYGYFERWKDLGAGRMTTAVFAVNHRQSKPLGEFVRSLHTCLFGVPPLWKSSKRSGPLPRMRRQRASAGLAEAVADEIRYWRQAIPNATVGVLFHGKRWDGLRRLADRVETALQDTLTSVYLAVGSGRAHYLGRADCAVIATVRGTKGLEFDATVVIDPHGVWKRPLEEIETVRRNAMYVSASRGRQGLSLIVDDRSILMSGGIDASLFDRVDPRSEE